MTEKELKRQKKQKLKAELLEKEQAKHAQERENETMMEWVRRTFRLITIFGTIAMSLLTWYNAAQAGVENLLGTVAFSATGIWCTFGLIWVVSSIIIFVQSEKNPVDLRKMMFNVCGPLIVACLLSAAFLGF